MIKIIAVGNISKKYFLNYINDNKKLIEKKYRFEIIEVKNTDKTSEYKLINKYIKKNDYIISLYIEGKVIKKSKMKNIIKNNEYANIDTVFIIGGSEGLDDRIIEKSNELLSFSKMTYPHQLFRPILIEYIYECIK